MEDGKKLKLHVRNTFIVVTDVNVEALRLGRSKSDSNLSNEQTRIEMETTPLAKANPRPQAAASEHEVMVFLSSGGNDPKLDEEASSFVQGGPSWSAGAELHAEGQCRPCAWQWQRGGCVKDSACVYCHLCDEVAVQVASDKRKKAARRVKGMKKKLDKILPKEELERQAAVIRETTRLEGREGEGLKNPPPLGKIQCEHTLARDQKIHA